MRVIAKWVCLTFSACAIAACGSRAASTEADEAAPRIELVATRSPDRKLVVVVMRNRSSEDVLSSAIELRFLIRNQWQGPFGNFMVPPMDIPLAAGAERSFTVPTDSTWERVRAGAWISRALPLPQFLGRVQVDASDAP